MLYKAEEDTDIEKVTLEVRYPNGLDTFSLAGILNSKHHKSNTYYYIIMIRINTEKALSILKCER